MRIIQGDERGDRDWEIFEETKNDDGKSHPFIVLGVDDDDVAVFLGRRNRILRSPATQISRPARGDSVGFGD